MWAWVSLWDHMCAGARRDQERAMDALELELQAVANQHEAAES